MAGRSESEPGTNVVHVGIGTLLKGPLSVPPNQRAYSWKDDQIDDLLNDIGWAMEQTDADERDYFLGSIVLTTSADPTRPCVVDGQQRLASVTMIYAAMRDYCLTHGEPQIGTDIAADYLYNKDKWTKIESPRLVLSDEDTLFFTRQVLAVPASAERGQAKRTTDSHRRIAKAFEKITKKITSIADTAGDSFKELRRWDSFLQNNVKVLVMTVGDESRAYQIFETLNDRGLDLAIADLLKNYIFGKVGKNNLSQAKHHWSTALTRVSAGGREGVIKKFIHHFWSSKHGLTRERLLYKGIRAEIRNEQKALAFVEELGSSATNYAAVLSPSSDVWAGTGTRGRRLVEALRTLQMEQYKPLLLACLDVFDPGKPTELVKVLRILVSWSVRFQITRQLGSSEIERFYPKVAKRVRDDGIKTAAKLVRLFESEVPSDALFKSNFETYTEESEKLVRYYLHAIEERVRRDQGRREEQVTLDESEVNLEHILPQQPRLGEWPEFDEETAKVNKYRLGNQTLLLEEWNRESSNSAFDVKRKMYERSAVEITKPILENEIWSPETILERQSWLADIAVRTWPLGV
jgi:hypothetical protein